MLQRDRYKAARLDYWFCRLERTLLGADPVRGRCLPYMSEGPNCGQAKY